MRGGWSRCSPVASKSADYKLLLPEMSGLQSGLKRILTAQHLDSKTEDVQSRLCTLSEILNLVKTQTRKNVNNWKF